MPSKKDKKNAKENGGIAAAVTKQAAGKFSTSSENNSTPNSSRSRPQSTTSSPPTNTPDLRPTGAPNNVNPAVSPMLDALSATSVSASTAPSMTNEWARGGLAGSPGNLISLMGESPPTQPSSYEDSARMYPGWAAHRGGFMSSSPASPSPPNSVRRPLSFQMEAHYPPTHTPSPASAAAFRRSSMQSQYSHARSGSNPPLPHQPQMHFYGAPDMDLTITPQSGMKAGDRGYFFGFDQLPTHSDAKGTSDAVVLAGYEGGLDIYAVNKGRLDPVGSLKGLRGGVHHAKILPWKTDGADESSFPHVAVVIHGPVLSQNPPNITVQDESPRLDGAASPRSTYTHQDGYPSRSGQGVDSYQTAVHVYSLKTNKLVDVLLEMPKVKISSAIAMTSPIFEPPAPTGDLTIKADGGTIAVCAGTTGECWIYLQLLEDQNGHAFACAGKLWTCLQQSARPDVAEERDKMSSATQSARHSRQAPIVALNGRWIAYCPSTPSSQLSLRAHIPVPTLGKAPGVSSATPPHLPAVTSAVDLPISDSVVNKIMRETTQELIQGAKWVGQQGLQAWNSYWNRPTSPPNQQQQQARSPPQHWPASVSPHSDQSQFPPTHGTSSPSVSKDPGIVSVLDAEALPLSGAVHPLTTFAAPMGCSFLSFSPTGLSLFTASSKGDVQTVWDLLRIQHTKSSPLQSTLLTNDNTGPLVRQIAQFSRMTVARIVEVNWSEPHGDRIAMVTERGTVHLLDMPFSAFMWPPPRRRKAVKDTETSEPASSAVSIASGAFGAAYQAAKPFVTRSRRSSTANITNAPAATTGSTIRDSAAHGGRVIAASITSSLGKTGSAINHLRHTGENRVALPLGPLMPVPGCVTWVKTKKSHVLYGAGGGLVRAFPYKTRRSSVQDGKRSSRSSRYKDLKVPPLHDDIIAPAVRQILEQGSQEEILDLSDREMEAGNTMTLPSRPPPQVAPSPQGMDLAIPQAEIESSAPYQPFHTDRRIALFEYKPDTEAQLDVVSDLLAEASIDSKALSGKKKKKSQTATPGTAMPLEESSGAPSSASLAWAFGQDIPSAKRDLGLPPLLEDSVVGAEDHMALPPSAMERVMLYGEAEQIVVTTRRRRGGTRTGEGDEDGFFEDDCEVLDFADQRV